MNDIKRDILGYSKHKSNKGNESMQDTRHELWLIYKELEDAIQKPIYDDNDAAIFKQQVCEAQEKLGKIINNLPSPAAALGSRGGLKGGKAKSKEKQAAARLNGLKGGRPKSRKPGE